ncbi:MarR family transcriptional regulator [Haloferax sp. ATB1]|uniref:MarR family transcriptional regulator n=1 Tax=Haloferax sp. ATB1 TaxID=1508454 RepID=UPI0005B1E9BF|nr:MarR family transcriptional regulator [Haloferax sp. ATB1]
MTLAVDDAVRPILEDEPANIVAVWLVLQEADEPMTTNEVAEASTFSTTAARRALRRLLDHGLVTRRPDPKDGRRPIHEPKVPPTDAR